MAFIRASLTFVAGIVVGSVASWCLGLLRTATVPWERGMLAVPLLVVATGAYIVARRSARVLAVGLISGAVLETLFFLYLFNTWGF